eukprot:UN17040
MTKPLLEPCRVDPGDAENRSRSKIEIDDFFSISFSVRIS